MMVKHRYIIVGPNPTEVVLRTCVTGKEGWKEDASVPSSIPARMFKTETGEVEVLFTIEKNGVWVESFAEDLDKQLETIHAVVSEFNELLQRRYPGHLLELREEIISLQTKNRNV
jgi:hypothetical protein